MIIKQFKHVQKGDKFLANDRATAYIKVSTRTARHIKLDKVFYFGLKETCYLIK